MIWIKKEGEESRRGLNILGAGGFGLILFLAGYKWRIKLGFYRTSKKTHWFHRLWTLDHDFKEHRFIHNLYTREEMEDRIDAETSKLEQSTINAALADIRRVNSDG